MLAEDPYLKFNPDFPRRKERKMQVGYNFTDLNEPPLKRYENCGDWGGFDNPFACLYYARECTGDFLSLD